MSSTGKSWVDYIEAGKPYGKTGFVKWLHEEYGKDEKMSTDAFIGMEDFFKSEIKQLNSDYDRRTDILNNHIARERVLEEFFREAVGISFEGGDWNGADIQDKAVDLGLAHWEQFDPEKHDSLGSFDGDTGDSILILDLVSK